MELGNTEPTRGQSNPPSPSANGMVKAPNSAAVLAVRNVSCSYGGVRAVRDVSFEILGGQFIGLIGPNGAGKSTLIDCISGYNRKYHGHVLWNGKDISRERPHRIARSGVVRGFQAARVFKEMTCLSNVAVAGPDQRGEGVPRALFGGWKGQDSRTLSEAGGLLERLDLRQKAGSYASALSGGQQRLLELARILMVGPRFLLLDEPFVGVSPVNRARLADLLSSLVADHQMTILMVEHRLELVERLCQQVIVMAEGRVLASGTMEEMRGRADVLDAYLGRKVAGNEH